MVLSRKIANNASQAAASVSARTLLLATGADATEAVMTSSFAS
jgi:hypothetical protein